MDDWELKRTCSAKVNTFRSDVDGINIHYASMVQQEPPATTRVVGTKHGTSSSSNKTATTTTTTTTIVFLTGWKETFYRYTELFQHFYQECHYNVFTMDHRSQGFSDDTPHTMYERGNDDGSGRRICYVPDFDGMYVEDVRQFLMEIVLPTISREGDDDDDDDFAAAAAAASRVCIIGRSMGGAITTRLLQKYPQLMDRAVALVPMYQHKNILTIGTDIELPLRLSRFVGGIVRQVGLEKTLADGRDTDATVGTTELLTHSDVRRKEWDELRRSYPQLVLAGASFEWAAAAIEFERLIMNHDSSSSSSHNDDNSKSDVSPSPPPPPLLIFQAENDSFVYNSAMDEYVATKVDRKDLVMLVGPVKGSYHELLVERDEIRTPIIDVLSKFASCCSGGSGAGAGAGAGGDAFSKEVMDAIHSVPVLPRAGSEYVGSGGAASVAKKSKKKDVNAVTERLVRQQPRPRRWPSGHHSGLRPPTLPMPLILRDNETLRECLSLAFRGMSLAFVVRYGMGSLSRAIATTVATIGISNSSAAPVVVASV